jgi:hypothetical protein
MSENCRHANIRCIRKSYQAKWSMVVVELDSPAVSALLRAIAELRNVGQSLDG